MSVPGCKECERLAGTRRLQGKPCPPALKRQDRYAQRRGLCSMCKKRPKMRGRTSKGLRVQVCKSCYERFKVRIGVPVKR